MHPYAGNWVITACAVVYYVQTAHAFSAGIIFWYWPCIYTACMLCTIHLTAPPFGVNPIGMNETSRKVTRLLGRLMLRLPMLRLLLSKAQGSQHF